MGEIDAGQVDIFCKDILPHIHLCPVADRENPEMFPHPFFSVEHVPEFRTLVLWVPLPEFITMGKEPLFGPGLLFIAARTPDGRIEFVCFDGIKQGNGLQHIPAGIDTCFFYSPSFVNRFLYRTHQQPCIYRISHPIPEFQGFNEIVTGINVQ